ncbi:UPF0182 family membrane protein [Desmospora profundinema]|uniref:UPF0182 protein JOE21_002586 n=1 Tax=Desmospora profundinema TaxID=1571184 RepID=A0ABU1IP62_9BACL|nr:UPF0182 family protein [Desmospora profundinema]MDR6226579.1 uncharacterized membrane protein (UPF0182 family) [Desmospora profundinema]
MKFKVIHNENPLHFEPPKKLITLGKWLGGLLLFLIISNVVVNRFADYIWMESLGFRSVFTTIFMAKITLGLIGFFLFFTSTFILFSNIRSIFLREFPNETWISLVQKRKSFIWLNTILSAFCGLLGSLLVQGLGWEPWLAYLSQSSFGVADPYFGHDVSFFVYTLPLWNFALSILLFIVGAAAFVKLILYSLRGLIKHSIRAQRHFLISVILFGLLITVQFLLAPYEKALTNSVNLFQDSVVFGVSYTDHWINIPLDYTMAGVSLLATVLFILAIVRQRFRFFSIGIGLFFGTLLLGGAASVVVQNFIVSPNEYVKEEPYLQHNLDYTRKAYELDEVDVQNKEINDTLSEDMLKRNQLTIDNIRINDARPLKDVYNQLQTLRPYYSFNDIDVDRYEIDGKYQQVFISVRELTQQRLPDQAQTWVNKHLRYTHGYGVSISNVNEITSEGLPEYVVKDLPPEGPVDIKKPQIYFGENDYNTVIVGSKVNEFDYPTSDENKTHNFEANTGIPMTGLNRFLFALDEKSFRYLVSDQITSESQLLQTRNIVDRVKRIAPFLQLDDDPYPVVRDDGSIVWLLDAFTMTHRYPFSDTGGHSRNYMKNPVKIAVDAYTGEVTFYLLDSDEPIAKTYQNIFPGLFETDIPEDIRSHFRYPIDLFKVQADMYRTYHMTNLELFYNREDVWQVPTEKYFNDDVRMEPYYVTMKLDDSDQEEFILMLPFTPNTKQNMIAWMAVRNDGEHYGETLVYQFTKQKNIYGPQQIENRINQNASISQQLNLWSQGGSRVIRGNLLVVPIEDTVMYVEPLYIESNNETSLPEVKQVIVAYQDYIVMEPTLERSIQRLMELIGEGVPPEKAEEEPQGEEKAPETTSADQLLKQIEDTFHSYQKANQNGNYEEAGRALKQLEQLLQKWREQEQTAENPDEES